MALQARSGGRGVVYLTFLSVVSALGGLLFGFDTAVISGTLTPLRLQFSLSNAMEGWLVSSALVGSALGAGVAGMLSDRWGRKPTLILSGFLLVVCSIGCAFAWNVYALTYARWIGGLGVGLASLVSPLYIAEVSPSSSRGRMVTLFQLAITIGICLALFSNSLLHSLSAGGQLIQSTGLIHWMVVDQVWRSMFGVELFPSILFMTLCFVIPETPRWLIKEQRLQKASVTLEHLFGSAVAAFELGKIREGVASEDASFMSLFRRGFRRPLIISLFLAIGSELSGITVVFYYGPNILEKAGFTVGNALDGFVSIGLVNVVFTLVAIWLMDHAGRRGLLLTGCIGGFGSLAALGVLFLRSDTTSALFVLLMCAFVAFFAFSMGPVKWVIMSEIFPTKIRGRAMALSTVAVWVTDGLLNQFFPLLREHAGVSFCFLIFAIALLPQIYFVWKLMPETKGRSLEEIEASWSEPMKDAV